MTVDIDQVALDIARQFVDGGQRKAQLQVAIIEAINRFAKPGSAWKADRAGAAWVVASPSGDACEVRDTDRSPYAEVMRQLAQSLGNSEIGGEVDVYYQIADMIEPHVQREGINPNGALPASVHDSVQILFNHWLKTRNPAEQVTWSVLQIGNKGAAYDPMGTRRAFTYEDQPGNVIASKLGDALCVAQTASYGDSIDRGLVLLRSLQGHGFGVFQIDNQRAAREVES